MSEFLPPSSQSNSPLSDATALEEANAFANNEEQLSSEFLPPLSSAESPLLDPKLVGEMQAFANNDDQAQKRKHADEIHGMRLSHSNLLLLLAILWIFVIFVVVLLQGFGQWFTPIPKEYSYLPFKLTDTLLITFITSTTGTVLGLYGIAAYWLYGKKAEQKTSPKDKKK
ncbi:hypothetical protein [Pseudomonas sp. RA_35y_Pfl2_P32]|uniref:hypothetical protein n=1 Tax=Pseudomonas sp. RA_35y_Pfl2_P32 TaxID=3088705 RepID=UPI0030D6E78D